MKKQIRILIFLIPISLIFILGIDSNDIKQLIKNQSDSLINELPRSRAARYQKKYNNGVCIANLLFDFTP